MPGVGWAAFLYANALDEGTACHQSFFKRKVRFVCAVQLPYPASASSEFISNISRLKRSLEANNDFLQRTGDWYPPPPPPVQTFNAVVQGAADATLQKAISSSRASEYRTFGAVVLLFNLVPVVNYVLNFGNAAGAALWAADVEASHWRFCIYPERCCSPDSRVTFCSYFTLRVCSLILNLA